jgi:hypothetical protein
MGKTRAGHSAQNDGLMNAVPEEQASPVYGRTGRQGDSFLREVNKPEPAAIRD